MNTHSEMKSGQRRSVHVDQYYNIYRHMSCDLTQKGGLDKTTGFTTNTNL